MTTPNPWLDFLEEDDTGRKAGYFSYGGQFGGPGRSQKQANFFQNSFTDIYNQYLGTLGQQARQGLMPTGTLNNYLGGFDFNKYYREQVPYETRNAGQSAFVPQVQWDVLRR